jgi:hypothetical protein
LSAGTATSLAGPGKAVAGGEGFFSLRHDRGRWRLSAPDDTRFFALGLHPDSSHGGFSELEIADGQRHYGRDAQQWIRPDRRSSLEQGGFNSWSSAGAGGDPYCHLVPFSGAERWDQREHQVNYLHRDWEHCLPCADDRNLIGYFYSASPRWLHAQPQAEWRGPVYDPAMLMSEAGRRELRKFARRYYQTPRDAIRRYDQNHLLLGDRYDGSVLLPREVHEEAHPRVDAFSLQDFRDPVANVHTWHRLTGKPILLADTAPIGSFSNGDLAWYGSLIRELLANPGCVGCHLVAARDELNEDEGRFLAWQRVNEAAERWLARLA